MNVIDRVESAKHALTGSGIGRAVSKATSHEIIGPKRKHVEYITHALEASNISIPDTADMLFERCTNSSWVVVFKSLVTFHHLMSNANERFMQYVASRSTTWMLQTFLDKGGVQGYDMSHAIRRYSSYLAEKAYCYRQMGYDFCRIARGKDGGVLRNMDAHKLLKALPSIQSLLDALIATEINSNDLTNGVITAAFMLLFKDLIRLFACYNDGIINLLEKYFEMKKADCKSALEVYKRFLARMERVSEFLKAAEDAGIDKGDIPDLTQAPNSLLEALESHYQSLEKGKSVAPPSKPLTLASFNADNKGGSSSFNGFSSGPSPTAVGQTQGGQAQDDYLLEQKRMLEMFEKKKREENEAKQRSQQQNNIVPNPLSPPAPKHHMQQPSSVPSSSLMQDSSFHSSSSSTSMSNNKPSDDLLMLSGNPSSNFATSSAFGQQSNMFGNNAFNTPTMNSSLGMNADFNSAFSNTPSTAASASNSTPNLMDDLLQPERQGVANQNPTEKHDGRMTGDLNKGLERMAKSLDGLDINPNTLTANTQRGHQWNPQQPTKITGGANFQVRPVAPSTLPPTMGMGGMPQQPGMMQPGMGGNQMFNQHYQMQPNMQMQMQPQFGSGMQQRPMYGGYGMMQSGGMQPHQGGMYQNNMGGMGINGMQSRPMMSNTSNPLMMNNDPFK